MTIWSIGEVMEFVEHPERRVRCGEEGQPELVPFDTVNNLGALLNNFSKEDQEMYISNFFDTLEQCMENS